MVDAAWPLRSISKLKSLHSGGRPSETSFLHNCPDLSGAVKALSMAWFDSHRRVAQSHPITLPGALAFIFIQDGMKASWHVNLKKQDGGHLKPSHPCHLKL